MQMNNAYKELFKHYLVHNKLYLIRFKQNLVWLYVILVLL